jgi:hypothetical protein
VSGVPTGIHFAFTDRLMRERNGITIRGNRFSRGGGETKPSFPDCIRIRDQTDLSIQLTLPPREAPHPPRGVLEVSGDQTNSETELEGFSPSSNLICKHLTTAEKKGGSDSAMAPGVVAIRYDAM